MLRLLFALMLALPGLAACRAEQGMASRAPSGLEIVQLKIKSGDQVRNFRVEVARSEAEQQKGLMFRERLGPDEGMLFPFPVPRPASFWMKNTIIPLDMIFVRADGSIARIEMNTIPESLDPVGVGEPVAAVLELAGGRTAELNISEGDRVSWPGGPAL
jgi:uncharacterized membrane protein (UPF0127 family)